MLSLATDYSFAMNLDMVQGRSTKLHLYFITIAFYYV